MKEFAAKEKLEIVLSASVPANQSGRQGEAGGRGVWGEFRPPSPASSVRIFSNRHRQMTKIESGVVHEVPQDLKKALRTSEELIETWNGLTPLGRNEWICWVEFVKKPETRAAHITRLVS